jgi:superfamily II DNA or RNA helicase
MNSYPFKGGHDMGLKKSTKVMPHQQSAVDKTHENDGSILLTHGMGLGKTLSSIAISDSLRQQGKAKKVLAVVPASLRSNFVDNGVNRYTNDKITLFGAKTESHSHIDDTHIPNTPYYVVSYDMFRKDPHKYLDKTGADTMIVDEMHNFRNPNTINYQQMKSVRGRVKNFIGLTGTPLNNEPYDIVPLINIVSNGQHSLGASKKEFSQKYISSEFQRDMRGRVTSEKVDTVINKEHLQHQLGKWVHHADSSDLSSDAVPKKVVQDIDVEMSPTQVDHYKFVMRRVPYHVRERIRRGMPVSRKEAFHVLPMLQQSRNVMNGIHYLDKSVPLSVSAERTPKIKRVLDDIEQHMSETKDAQIVVHSHMLEGGVDVVSAGLNARGIPHGVFTGKIPKDERDKAVKEYNSGKKKVMLISSAGTTGLNLPNTTMHMALDSHYNPATNEQIEARGIRAGGLSHREPENRRVIVRRYRSVHPDTMMTRMGLRRKDVSVDEWIHGLAENKQGLNNQVDSLLKSASWEDGYAMLISIGYGEVLFSI